MDLLVVAAVAGAGCLAKYLNKLSKNGDSSSLLSFEDSNFENAESPFHPFCTQAGGDSLDRRGDSNVSSQDCLLTKELAFNREKVRPFRNCNESDIVSVSNFNDIGYGNEQSSSFNVAGSCSFLLTDLSAGKFGHSPPGSKASHRTKHFYGHISRPLNSLESCLMAQLCKEHTKMEESGLLPSTATRSFLVIDGNQMISRANYDNSFSGLTGSRLHGEASKVKDKSVLCGVPCLPKIGSSTDAKKMKFDAGNRRSRRLRPTSHVISGKHIHTQHDETFLFSLGISFGIITSILANKREMDKLIELLKQTENLVQDVREELEMKDSMRVKELHNENYGSQDTCDQELNGFSPEKHTDNSPITNCKKSCDQKEEESSDSISKIEAELEAELERLGLNMNESSPERPLSELVELDPDFVADFAQGDDLRTDMISGKDVVHSELNEDDSDTLIPVNYAVSPHELTLRLHEVTQSRLKGRVQELEIALENSQRKLRFMESERQDHPQKYFSSCGQASSFTKANLLAKNDCEPITTEPLVMNLFGESPGAFIDTSYEEIIKIDDFEENSPSSIHISDYKVDSHSHDLHALGVQHCRANDLLTHSAVNEERLSRELSSGEVTMLEGLSSSNYELNDVTGDENCDCDYEMEKQLIRQIVERTKKGSPVFRNARKILYAMDDD